MGIASLILGIIGILLVLVPLVGTICSILAIIYGIVSLRRKKRVGMSIAGLSLGIIGIVIFIVVLVVALPGVISEAIPRFKEQNQKHKAVMTETDIDIISTALELYWLDIDHYPSTKAGLKALEVRDPADDPGDKWNGPYLKRKLKVKKSPAGIPTDRWGNELQYTSDGKSFTIISYGADGKPGGTGFDKDIKSGERYYEKKYYEHELKSE
ncbi:MAG TPA: hypothetical protein ENH97_03240 [bacterium]|nr:hypothetical protein [bacterium]